MTPPPLCPPLLTLFRLFRIASNIPDFWVCKYITSKITQKNSISYIYIYPLLLTADRKITWKFNFSYNIFSLFQVLFENCEYFNLFFQVSIVYFVVWDTFFLVVSIQITVVNMVHIFYFPTPTFMFHFRFRKIRVILFFTAKLCHFQLCVPGPEGD